MSGGSIKPIKLWAITKDGKIDPWSISPEKDFMLSKGEKLVRVIVSHDTKRP